MPLHGRRNPDRTTLVRAAIFALVLAAGVGGAARAAETDEAPAVVRPPRVIRFVEAPRPAGAEAGGAVAVELELTIGADGALADARVAVSAGADFDAAALAAVRQFTFEPARRGERATAARVRYRYTFEAVAPALDAGAAPPAPSDAVGAPPSPDGGAPVPVPATVAPDAGAPSEAAVPSFGATASIAAPPREVTKRTLGVEELTNAAGTRGDPLRVIELLPGVARPPNLQGFLLIRGSGPEDSQVVFEGGPVDRLYHFGGLTSFTNARLLDHIDLYPGNFSARYGRKVGGIVDVGVRDPKRDALHSVVDVNLIDASVLVEGPLGERGAFAVAARRSYVDVWFRDVIPEDALGVTAAPVYYDYQAIYSYHADSGAKLRVMLFGSADGFKLTLPAPADGDPSVQGSFRQSSSFHRLQATWRQALSPRVDEELTAGIGTLAIGNGIGAYALDVSGYDAFARAEWRVQFGDAVKLVTGFDGYALTGDLNYFGPKILAQDGDPRNSSGPLTGLPLGAFDGRFTTLRPAAYVEALVQAGARLLLVPGVRADYFSEDRGRAVDPRFSARLRVAAQTTIKGGVGLFSQPPQYGETVAGIGNPKLGLTHAQHYGLGVEQGFGAHGSLGLDSFYKRLSDVEVNGTDANGQTIQVNGGTGRIYGLEVLAKLNPTRRGYAFVSYTLSRSERNDGHGQGWRLFDYDQTHILTVAGGARLPRSWEVGATFRLVSGNPSTPVTGAIYDANRDYYAPVYGATNSARDPLFHQLNVRVEKTWKLHAWQLAAYLDVQNVYNHRSQEGLQYSYDYARSAPVAGLPVLPSLGVRGEL
jgi:TonB family protein